GLPLSERIPMTFRIAAICLMRFRASEVLAETKGQIHASPGGDERASNRPSATATRVSRVELCVGIISRPARNIDDGESTAMHRTGTLGTGRTSMMNLRSAHRWTLRCRIALRLRWKTRWFVTNVNRHLGPTSRPFNLARPYTGLHLIPSDAISSVAP